jgi:DNA-binding CsgD family transcriptional regulator
MTVLEQASRDCQHLINQLDGFYSIVDLDSKCLLLNQTAAKWLGFGSPERGIGTRYEDIQAPAVESSDFFYEIDRLVIQNNTRVFYLGYYGYHDGYRVIQGIKAPYLDNTKTIIGVSCQFQDITNLNIANKDHLIFQPDYITKDEDNIKQFCYLFIEKEENNLLSEREKECLFFLLRRKTAKEIGTILSLSHRTVEDHIERIRLKLKCQSTCELLEKATVENFGNQLPLKYLKTLWEK